jgi:MscS family membrane protein
LVLEGLDRFGLSLFPLFAGLGVGGFAVAFAVRPTLENLIGSIILIADKPVSVGDFCRFNSPGGNRSGIVEKIGLRSTRLRTRGDTLVTIPNAEFSQIQLENLSSREMTLMQASLALRYETTVDQLRYVLAQLRKMMIGHPEVSPERLWVRFKDFGDSSLDVEIFAYIRTNSYQDYRAIREDINLRIIDIVKEAGTGFAFPSQTIYFRRDTGLNDEKTRQSEVEVEGWRSKRDLPFPDIEPEDKDKITDTLDYPPAGSPKMIEPDKRFKLIEIWKWKRHKRPDKQS